MNSSWLIRLNRVDCITLISIPLSLLALQEALNGKILSALALLYLAMTADALDGMLARRWNLTRNFGRYLDGFMDVMIYLAVPSVILLQWGFNGFWSVFLMLMVACGCVRLSVFNDTGNIGEGKEGAVDESSADGLAYQGMPVFWSLFLIAPVVLLNQIDVFGDIFSYALLALMLTVFSYLMVRNARFFKFTSLKQILTLTLGGFSLLTLGSVFSQSEANQAQALLTALYLQVPVVIGGVLHMVVVSRNQLPALAKPIWTSAFGANKTWRGFVVVPVLTALGALVLWPLDRLLAEASPFYGLPLWQCGAVAGLGYMLAELPNSWVKRRLGIGAGELPEQGRVIAVAMDQLDSAIGVAIAYALWLNFDWNLSADSNALGWNVLVWYVVTFPLTALVVKAWLHRNALKSSAV